MTTIEDRIVISLLTLGTHLTREGNRITDKFGVNQQQFIVLRYIADNGPLMQKEICSRLLFEKSHVSKITKKLQQLDLINVTRLDTDNRTTSISITPKGVQLVEEIMNLFAIWNNQWLSSLSETEKLHSELVLDKLINLE